MGSYMEYIVTMAVLGTVKRYRDHCQISSGDTRKARESARNGGRVSRVSWCICAQNAYMAGPGSASPPN